MEAKAEAPVAPAETTEPEFDASQVVDARELSSEELAAIQAVEGGHTEKNLSGAWKDAFAGIFGGIVGFVGVGYLNSYLMDQAAASGSSAGDIVTYAAVVAVVEIVVGGFLVYYGMKKNKTMGDLVAGFGLGLVLAGVGTVLTKVVAQAGGPALALSATTLSPSASMIPTRAIATPAMVYGEARAA